MGTHGMSGHLHSKQPAMQSIPADFYERATPKHALFCTRANAGLVVLAQNKSLHAGGADDWYIDSAGRACLYNVLDTQFVQGFMSYVKPQLFDKDSLQCNPSILGIHQDHLASRTGASGEITPAVPIPSCQNVPYDEATGKGCDKL